MSQAKRRSPVKKKSTSNNAPVGGLLMLFAGILIGSLGTILWQGMQSSDGEVGSGIRKMMEQSKEDDEKAFQQERLEPQDAPVKQETNFDFYTVLPEIEVVVPDNEPETPATPKVKEEEKSGTAKVVDKSPELTNSSAYMLQAGSYQRQSDADKLKAQLGLMGFSSNIQKVTIQGRGDFFRVRLGPYTTHNQMVKVDDTLSNNGIKTLRLKISKGG
jgi:cell division protein FtsN